MLKFRLAILYGLAAIPCVVSGDYTISSDATDANGIRRIMLESKFQPGPVLVRILAPQNALNAGAGEQRFLYVLPVEPRDETKYGDGFTEVVTTGLAQKYGLIVVAPSFAQLPWYADHPSKEEARQESQFLKAVLPAVEQLYPSKKAHRLLLGFSKSGWGAYSLILRHPEMFDAATAWDSPLMKDKPDQFGMGGVFITQDNFEGYQISRLLREKAESFQKTKRLLLGGYGNFRKHTQDAHTLMESLGIQHAYADGPSRKHIWGSGWIDEAVRFLEQADK